MSTMTAKRDDDLPEEPTGQNTDDSVSASSGAETETVLEGEILSGTPSSDKPANDTDSGDAGAEPRAFTPRPGVGGAGGSYAGSGGNGAGGGFGDTENSNSTAPDGDENPLGNLWIRAAYMVGFGVLAWLSFYVTLFLGLLQLIVGVLNKELNEDLQVFSGRMVRYLGSLMRFITFQTDDKPFPFGPFPKDTDAN